MFQNTNACPLKLSLPCEFCKYHNKFEPTNKHICEFNTTEHKIVCEHCRTLSDGNEEASGRSSNKNVYINKAIYNHLLVEQNICKLNKLRAKKENEGLIFVGYASAKVSTLQLAPKDSLHQEHLLDLIHDKSFSSANPFIGEVEKTIGKSLNDSLFKEYNQNTRYPTVLEMLISPYAFPLNKFNEDNVKKIISFITDGLYNSKFLKIQYFRWERGMMKLKCLDANSAKLAVNVLSTLSFRLAGSQKQYPLIATRFSTTAKVLVTCKVSKKFNWIKFRNTLAFENNLIPSMWELYEIIDVDDQNHSINFYIDSKTLIDINEKGNYVTLHQTRIEVKELHNIFNPDVKEYIKLDKTMITFHWYVRVNNNLVVVPRCQIDGIKELKIDQLPVDFDGGTVLKFIIEEMKLDKFYFGTIPLIVDENKQDIKEFEANQNQITSIFEMVTQFQSIKKIRFIMSETDINSDKIQKITKLQENPLKKLEIFELVDKSGFKSLIGVFLGFFKKMRNLKTISLETQDRNINVLLEEFLGSMPELEEIFITSEAPKAWERLMIIQKLAHNLKKISVASQYFEDAKKVFGRSVMVCSIDNVCK